MLKIKTRMNSPIYVSIEPCILAYFDDNEMTDAVPFEDKCLAAEWLTRCGYYCVSDMPFLWRKDKKHEAMIIYAEED